jgi:quercetin dioxygenase-like cupin family protein
MRLVSPARRAALVAAAVTAAAGAAIAFSTLGGSPAAAGTPPSPAPSASASADPIITPLAAALVRIDFRAGDTTGWHSHPGPVFVQVVSGAVTLRHADHGRCLSQVIRAGHGFFEAPGAVHVAENPRPDPAVLYATFVLPPGAGPEVSAPVPAPCR